MPSHPAAPTFSADSEGGVVCSVDRLASDAGVALLEAGGSAADAAVAASAVLAVTTQHMCGMGGDLFALVDDGRRDGPGPAALNASGRSGTGPAVDSAALRREGHESMPFRGDFRSVTVPGCVDGWLALHDRFGRRPLSEVLAPAIHLADTGFSTSPLLARALPHLAAGLSLDDFRVGDRLATSGDVIRRPRIATALRRIVAEGRSSFYAGDFGRGLLAMAPQVFTDDDLARSQASWTAAIGRKAFGHEIWTTPPNSQGYLVPLSAAIGDLLTIDHDADAPASGRWVHLLCEAARAAGHDRPDFLHEGADARSLLTATVVSERAAAIDVDRRGSWPTTTREGGTIYLCAIDAGGMGVSLIQSNAAGFGAHLVEPATGIFLQNRGIGFSLEPGHPAELRPGRRPPHTLAPVVVRDLEHRLRATVGTMGGDSQPQILLQLLARLLIHDQSPAAAIAAPRWVLEGTQATGFDTWAEPDATKVAVEAGAPTDWTRGLARRGHRVVSRPAGQGFGHAQVIVVGDGGRRSGAADPRSEIGSASATSS